MDVASSRESRPGASMAETPASVVSQYSNLESTGLGIEGFEQSFDGLEMLYDHEMDPMIQCMGAPTREATAPVSNLSRAQEEAILATLNDTFDRTRAQQYEISSYLQVLRDASKLMQKLWEEGSLQFPRAVEELLKLNSNGNFSTILGEAGFVDVFMGILGTGDVLDEITIPSLRFLGNACVKSEANKARVVSREAILPILYKLWNPSLVPVAIPVILQICENFEPAQQQAADLATARILIDLLKRPESEGVPKGGGAYPVLTTVCRILDMMSTIGTELYSDATARELFDLAKKNEDNLELYMHLINTAATWLKLSRVRQHFVADDNAEILLCILEESCTRPNLLMLSTPDGAKLLQNLRIAVVEALSAISMYPQFCVNYKVTGNFVATLRGWLPMAYPQLQACACIVLGNMANSWTIAREMTQQFRLHDLSLLLLEQCDSVQVKAAAAMLLKSLLVSRECRREVAEKPIVKVTSQLWSMDDSPHLQFLGVTLAMQALEESFPVLGQLLAPLSPDPDSPAHSKTQLTILLRLWQDYHGYRSHEKLLETVACIIANMCAMLWSPGPTLCPPREMEKFKERMLLHHADLGYPLGSLLSVGYQPRVRSKFWFVMALMADDPLTVGAVGKMLGTAEVSKALSAFLSCAGQVANPHYHKSQSQYQNDDRNVLIMISRLMKNTDAFKNTRQSELMRRLVEGIDLEVMSKENPLEPL